MLVPTLSEAVFIHLQEASCSLSGLLSIRIKPGKVTMGSCPSGATVSVYSTMSHISIDEVSSQNYGGHLGRGHRLKKVITKMRDWPTKIKIKNNIKLGTNQRTLLLASLLCQVRVEHKKGGVALWCEETLFL